jgi:hypothetical protein
LTHGLIEKEIRLVCTIKSNIKCFCDLKEYEIRLFHKRLAKKEAQVIFQRLKNILMLLWPHFSEYFKNTLEPYLGKHLSTNKKTVEIEERLK